MSKSSRLVTTPLEVLEMIPLMTEESVKSILDLSCFLVNQSLYDFQNIDGSTFKKILAGLQFLTAELYVTRPWNIIMLTKIKYGIPLMHFIYILKSRMSSQILWINIYNGLIMIPKTYRVMIVLKGENKFKRIHSFVGQA